MKLRKNRTWTLAAWALIWTGAIILSPSPAAVLAQSASPAPNPPRVELQPSAIEVHSALSQAPLAAQEWTHHKTSDHLHPDGNEQQYIWLMNRARANPAQEGAWLANTADARIESAISYWHVDLAVMQAEFDGYDAKPPAAFDVRLYYAARAHALDLIARDAQDHTGQFDHIPVFGFHYLQLRGNVFSYALDALYGHAAFNIDWGDYGNDGTGMQNPRGHRLAIMSIDGDYTNVGLAAVPESDASTEVGPLVTTANFCYADTAYADHYNRLLVGTVWRDANANDQYDPGEGMGGITVMPDRGDFFAVTANSGGYAFPVVSAGIYQVTFSGSGITTPVTRISVVAATSMLLDLKYTGSNANEPQAFTLPASEIAANTVNLNGSVYTNGFSTDYYFQYGTTTNYGATTPVDSVAADTAITAAISGLTEGTQYHYRLVATNGQGTSYGSDLTFQTASSSSTSASAPPAPSTSGSGGGGCFIGILDQKAFLR
jgi:hypothetical protein